LRRAGASYSYNIIQHKTTSSSLRNRLQVSLSRNPSRRALRNILCYKIRAASATSFRLGHTLMCLLAGLFVFSLTVSKKKSFSVTRVLIVLCIEIFFFAMILSRVTRSIFFPSSHLRIRPPRPFSYALGQIFFQVLFFLFY